MTVTINGTSYTNIIVGTPIKEYIGDELATLQFVIKTKTRITDLKKFDNVVISFGSDTRKFLLFNILEEQQGELFTYTITSIEQTKILENIIINGMALTPLQSDTSLYSQWQRLMNKLNGQCKGFNFIGGSFGDFLDALSPQEFLWDGESTVREILDDFLASADSAIKVDSVSSSGSGSSHVYTIMLNRDNPNRVGNNLGTSFPLTAKGLSKTKNSEYEVGGIRSLAENTVVYNSITLDYRKIRSDKPVDDTKDYIYITNNPIYDIESFKVKFNNYTIATSYNNGGDVMHAFNGTTTVDIIDRIVEKAEWNIMNTLYQNKWLYYERGKNNIYNFNVIKAQSFLDDDKVIERIVKEHIGTILVNRFLADNPEYNNSSYRVRFVATEADTNFTYELKYKTVANCLFDNKKSTSDNIINTRILSNQDAKKIDEKRYDKSQQAKIERIGNNEIALDMYSSNLYEIGDYFVINGINNYIVAREFEVLGLKYKVRYTIIEGYNAYQEQVNIKREKRTFNIPLTGYVDRYIAIENANAFNRLLLSKNQTTVSNYYECYDIEVVRYGTNREYRMCSCIDNYSVGVIKKEESSTTVNSFLKYTNDDGTLNECYLYLFDSVNLTSKGYYDANKLPLVDGRVCLSEYAGQTFFDLAVKEIHLTNLYKDPFERLIFVFIKD